jgi:hypothetical protein
MDFQKEGNFRQQLSRTTTFEGRLRHAPRFSFATFNSNNNLCTTLSSAVELSNKRATLTRQHSERVSEHHRIVNELNYH